MSSPRIACVSPVSACLTRLGHSAFQLLRSSGSTESGMGSMMWSCRPSFGSTFMLSPSTSVGSLSPQACGGKAGSEVSNSVTEQTWFPGVHADIGGGYLTLAGRNDQPRAIDDITLDWMIKRIRHHYTDFPSLMFGEVLGLEEQEGSGKRHPVQHESRRRQYLLSAPALRSIGNKRLDLLKQERLVSYDRSETTVGESIHISALDRLGEEVPYDTPDRRKTYAPRNVLAALADLRSRYSEGGGLPWGADMLSATVWSGEIVHEERSTPAVRQQVKRAIEEAIGRLSRRGVDVSAFGIGDQ